MRLLVRWKLESRNLERAAHVGLAQRHCRIAYPVQLIGRLFRIERLADARQLDTDARLELRAERVPAVLDKLKRWLVATVDKEPPSSELARAASYTLNQWDALTRFLEDGHLRLDNNLCEQQLRDVALGRKNFLFADSHDTARRTAVLYSLMRTCAQYGVAPLPYLTDVLRKLASGWDEHRLEDLLPDRWQRLHGLAPDISDSHAAVIATINSGRRARLAGAAQLFLPTDPCNTGFARTTMGWSYAYVTSAVIPRRRAVLPGEFHQGVFEVERGLRADLPIVRRRRAQSSQTPSSGR